MRKHKLDIIALALIVLSVIAANAIYVFGFRDPTPLLQLSGQAVQADERLIEGVDTLDPNNGFTSEALGTLAAKQITEGKVPFWNYYEGVGMPLAGEMQAAALSPFVIFLSLEGGLLISHIVLEIVAGFFTFLFFRQLGLRFGIAVIGGVAFALNGTFAWLTNAAFNPIAFLPMLLYGIEKAMRTPKEKGLRGWLWISLAIAGSLYAGFPETAFINTLLASLWALIRLFSNKLKPVRKQFIYRLALGYSIGLLLAAPILVAFLGYLPYADIGGHDGGFAKAGLPIMSLPALFLPYIYGPIAAFSNYDPTGITAIHWGGVGGYVPIMLLILAVFGLFSKLDGKLRVVLVLWIAAGLLKMFGVPIVEDIWNLVPTIESAAFFRYVTPSIYFAILILAMYGLDSLGSYKLSRRILWSASLIVISTFIALVFVARSEIWRVIGAPNAKIAAVLAVGWAAAMIVAVLLGLILIRRRYYSKVLIILLTVDLLLMFVVPQLSTPNVKIDSSPVNYLKQHIGFNRFYTLGPIAPNYGSYYQVASINHNDLPIPETWSEYVTEELDTNTPSILFTGNTRIDKQGPSALEEFLVNKDAYLETGVKYLVANSKDLSDDQIQSANLKEVFSTQFVEIFELPDARDYFVVSENCKLLSSPTRANATFSCNGEGTMLRRELYMPGWVAQVGGDNTTVRQKGQLFQEVDLPAGEGAVVFRYGPPWITLGMLGFVVGIVVILLTYQHTLLQRTTRYIVQFINRNKARIHETRKK